MLRIRKQQLRLLEKVLGKRGSGQNGQNNSSVFAGHSKGAVLSIRIGQGKLLETVQIKDFEDRMVKHLAEFFPQQYEALKEEGTRELIRHGIERTGSYEIVSERDVCKYIDLMVVFGRDFDKHPNQPWASQILNDSESLSDPSEKIEALYASAVKHLPASANPLQVGGPY